MLLLASVGLGVLTFLPKEGYQTTKIKIANATLTVLMADSGQKRALGLGGRDRLNQEGMLFIFPSAGYHSIWMKGMKFDLDIIWLQRGRIIDLATQVPAPKDGQVNLESYAPSKPADQVLEVEAGFVAKHGLKIGDEMTIVKE